MNELSPWRIRRLAGSENIEPDYIPGSQQDEVSLSFYWNILLKRRNFILAVFFAVFAVGAYFALSSTTYYTAAAMIKIEPQNPQVTGVGELQPLDLRGEYDYHKTQFELLKGRPLAAKVITQLKLESNKAFNNATIVSPNPMSRLNSAVSRAVRPLSSFLAALVRSKKEPDASPPIGVGEASGKVPLELTVTSDLIERYRGMLEVAPVSETRLVRVQFKTPDPALSQALANAHVQSFMQLSLEGRFGLTKEARDFLEQKKADLRSRLEQSEAALNKFRRSHGVVSVEKGENIVVDRLVELNRQLTTARAQRIEAESLYRTVENRNNQDLAEVMRQGLVQQLKSSVATLESEKARTATIFKPDHPRIQELNQQITAAQQALNNEIANVVRGIKSGYAAAFAKEQGLQAEADRQQRDALRLRELGVDYTLLQEEVNANRSLYEGVLKRLSETNFSNDLAISNMQIAERAAMPLSPSGPNVSMYFMASIMAGLVLGIGGAFIREILDSAVGTPEDVWRSVGLGTLGVVPNVKFLNRGPVIARIKNILSLPAPRPAAAEAEPPRELIVNHSSLSILNEAYRSIRTSLLLSQAEKPPQVILLTSPSPGEGKTVTSLNLAIALAQDSYSVLLVDADMRKGCCHKRLGLNRNSGLSNILTGRLSLDDGIHQTPIERLSLMSCGAPPPNPSELLGSRIMKETLKDLREIYDFILIDSPPVIGISDAAILSVLVDGVLLVLDGQNTSTPSAQKAVQRLDMVRARMLGVILNGVDLQDPHYSYFRSYSQYYTYGLTNEDNGTAANGNGSSHASDAYGNGSGAVSKNGASHGLGAGKSVNGSKIVPRADDVEPISAEGLSNLSQPEALVSQTSLSRVVEALTLSIGPLAPKIVQEHIASLGESRYAFPENRINDLLQSLKAAITDEQLKTLTINLFGNHSTTVKG
jgi:succinoglycan biosynthesis transport protein ExoP